MREWSVELAMKSWLLCCLLCVVSLGPGCRTPVKPNPVVAAELTNPAAKTATWKPNSFIDNPELRAGTGPMDADAALEFSATDSGLKYRILRKSDGKKPKAADTVSVNYRGWLNNGKVFDSSYERGEPTTFPLRNVIAGWTEGMQLIGQGGMIELFVPSKLGYGEGGSPGSIPAHANLHFIVELVSVD